VVFPFRKLAARTLLIIGLATLIASAAWNAKDTADLLTTHTAYQEAKAAGPKRTAERVAAAKEWQDVVAEAKPDAETLAKDVAAMRGGYGSALGKVGAQNLEAQSWWLYRYFFDVFGMMLLGMGLFKLGVLTLERRTRTYVAMMAGGYAIGLFVNILETRWILQNGFSVIAFSQANITYDLGRLAMTFGHLGALLLFCKVGALPWLRQSMAAVGRMALTNYLTHSVVALVLFIGLGQFGQFERHELYFIVFAIWAAQLVASPLWLAHYRFGPAEWLWRYLTYGKRPPMRRAAPLTASIVPAV